MSSVGVTSPHQSLDISGVLALTPQFVQGNDELPAFAAGLLDIDASGLKATSPMDRWNDSLQKWHQAHRMATQLKDLVFQAEIEKAQSAGPGPSYEQLQATQAAIRLEQQLYEAAMKAFGAFEIDSRRA